MSHVLILLNKWANYFVLLCFSVRQEFVVMLITYFLPNHCYTDSVLLLVELFRIVI